MLAAASPAGWTGREAARRGAGLVFGASAFLVEAARRVLAGDAPLAKAGRALRFAGRSAAAALPAPRRAGFAVAVPAARFDVAGPVLRAVVAFAAAARPALAVAAGAFVAPVLRGAAFAGAGFAARALAGSLLAAAAGLRFAAVGLGVAAAARDRRLASGAGAALSLSRGVFAMGITLLDQA
ncbi:hypothetical protein [Muricoccus nepalensis]|uniref:hypothetical protein n=1 Tax=Muricoccus nepalensis TaxID=1854500 RepID=UPI00112E458E|nr:hypothetical protein [Roseomonas nepalensis]